MESGDKAEEPLTGGFQIKANDSFELDVVIDGLTADAKVFTFDAIQTGDCLVESGATFTLYEDGATRWNCEISSGDTGDEWTMFITVKDSRGVDLFTTGRYHKDIKSKNKKKRWEDIRGANPNFAQYFSRAKTGSVIASCWC